TPKPRTPWSNRLTGSGATHRRGDVGLVAGRVGQRPPRRRERVTYHAAAGAERRRDAGLGLVLGHPDRHVDRAAAALARLVHSFEPECRPATVGIDEVLARRVGTRLVPEDRPPERHDLSGVRGARDDRHGLDGGRVRGQPLLARHRGDLPRQVHIARRLTPYQSSATVTRRNVTPLRRTSTSGR